MKKIIKSSMCLATAGVLALTPLPSFALSQDETVYVKLQENGVVKTISVTEHLINDLKDNELFDRSILTNIENLNGFEGFVVEGENVKWDANGKDIYYRGDAAKELPVKLSVSYFLDDEEKTPEEMLGILLQCDGCTGGQGREPYSSSPGDAGYETDGGNRKIRRDG